MFVLNLDSGDAERCTKDIYMSVRIGEVQKLTKFSASRSFKFPKAAVGDRRHGKIEIFRRVGGCSVGIDSAAANTIQEVSIPFEGFEDGLKLRVDLPSEIKEEEPAKSPKSKNPKVAVAKDYLEKHNLELRLSDAMQAVLRERPDDPAEFLSVKLTQSRGQLTKLPKEDSMKPTPPEPESRLPSDDCAAKSSPPQEPPTALKPDAEQEVLAKQSHVENLLQQKPVAQVAQVALAPHIVKSDSADAVTEIDYLRHRAREALLQKMEDGSLLRILSETVPPKAAREEAADETCKDPELEDLRRAASETLVQASKSGDLLRAVSEVKDAVSQKIDQPDGGLEDLRKMASETLCQAAQSGDLVRAVSGVRKPQTETPAEQCVLLGEQRRMVGETLPQTAESGERVVAVGREAPTLATSELSDTGLDDLKTRFREQLIQGARDGALARALNCVLPAAGAASRTETESIVDQLRNKAKQQLLAGARDGSLAWALSVGQVPSPTSDASELEDIKGRARAELLRGVEDGRLSQALAIACGSGEQRGETQPSDSFDPEDARRRESEEVRALASQERNQQSDSQPSELEKIKRRAQAELFRGAQDGRLSQALVTACEKEEATVREPSDSFDLEELRCTAREELIRVAQDGSLTRVLQAAHESLAVSESATAETVDNLRQMAFDALVRGAHDQTLAKALETALHQNRPSRPLTMMPAAMFIGPSFYSFGTRPCVRIL